jgi:hypothetical protein
VKRVGPGINKLADRSVPGVFLGYEPGTKGYRVYDPIKDKLMVSCDVIFDEKKAWNWEGKGSRPNAVAEEPNIFSVQCLDDTVPGPITGPAADDGAFSENGDGEPASPAVSTPSMGGASPPHTPPHQQIQWATPPTGASEDSEGVPLRYRIIPDLLDTTDEVQDFKYSALCLVAVEEPKNIEDALLEACWRRAMEEEMKAIDDNKTWVVSDLPPKQKAIGLKWVFKVKKDPDGRIVKHKARLVAKGYA